MDMQGGVLRQAAGHLRRAWNSDRNRSEWTLPLQKDLKRDQGSIGFVAE
jgi:hypothetical protein